MLFPKTRNLEEKRLWIHYLKRLIMENHPTSLPHKVGPPSYSLPPPLSLLLCPSSSVPPPPTPLPPKIGPTSSSLPPPPPTPLPQKEGPGSGRKGGEGRRRKEESKVG